MANITPLWEHQQRAVDFARDKPGSMLAMEMGTGKSKVLIDDITDIIEAYEDEVQSVELCTMKRL